MQVLSKRYLKPRYLSPRSGALVEISGISIKVVTKVVLNFLPKKGLLTGIMTGGVAVISKIPTTTISTYLRDSFPQNLPHLEKKKCILIGG